ncbi:serine protease 52-like [Hyposmocoma kahamanoa]|uniref:serine protease 52-like n=1 Tax=Hyposmocoma kahamanoa TaxID=1477025 RepID=UPI000E6D7C1E|nr:serine protease 52-like [Hyposmocoma kahamanoa]
MYFIISDHLSDVSVIKTVMKNLLSLVLLFGVVSWVSCDIEDKVQFVDITNIAQTDTCIIGGTPATIERYPFAAQIIYRGSLSCGGSLITVQNVLSAAHCFYDR